MGITACGTAEPEDGVEFVRADVSNMGDSCIDRESLVVDFDQCMSTSCDRLVDASCTGTVNGDTLTVTSMGAIETRANETMCTLDCREPFIECTVSGDLSTVTTIVYAGRSRTSINCSGRYLDETR